MSKTRKPIKYYTPQRRAWYAAGDCIDSLLLFDLFAWTCILCGKSIDPARRCPDWRAATVEHIVPFSKGGLHDWTNVAPAHARCNWDKSDTGLDNLAPSVLECTHLDRIVT